MLLPMKYLFVLLLFSSLYASISEPFTIEVGSGYREDYLKSRIYLPGSPSTLIYEEKYSPIRFVESEVTFRFLHRDIFILANGGYGALGTSDMKQHDINLSFSSARPSFTFDTDGFSGTFLGALGYMANLTPQRYYRVALAPLFGYNYYYEKIHRKSPSPNPYSASNFDLYSTLDKDLFFQWYGFFLGADVNIKPTELVTFDIFYAYQFLNFDQDIRYTLRSVIYSSPGVISSDTTETNKTRLKKEGSHGHLAMLRASFDISKHISLSLQGKTWYFFTGVHDETNRQVSNTSSSSTTVDQERKSKFTQLSFSFLLFMEFKI